MPIRELYGSQVSELTYTAERIQYWDNAEENQKGKKVRQNYRQRLIEIYSFLVPEGCRVLELGCGRGDLLDALRPIYGVGIDLSSRIIAGAQSTHPHLSFLEMNAQSININETFDYLVCSDLVNELWDVQSVLTSLGPLCHPQTRLLLNLHSNLWQGPRRLAAKFGLARPQLIQNWLGLDDIINLLYLANFEVIRTSSEVLWPFEAGFWSAFCNRVLVKIWPFRFFGVTNIIVARPIPKDLLDEPIVSVVVPARGEAGNIPAIFDRVPDMGRGTELIFVEGGSADDTFGVIQREMVKRQRPMTKLLQQTGKGKADAVRLGFANATGELLMILDADLTVAPEDLPRFYQTWRSGKADFVNGIRMVYPMEEKAMQFLNILGNKFFSLAFSFLLGQKVKDTACGTKVLSKKHYEPIEKGRIYFGDFDRFGDWDLLFGAAKYNLKIVDLPIRYRDRVFGQTKMQRWRIGILLVRMVILGLKRLKFV